ncbi:SagB/ThcOx family dehydrogenase [uncultured Methanofollis sp.]|uniref:SagB/ThcOx family dehydrogenase n=1 Tax=uncultured Methanofollis sp. TaxID=262500 RepID=UPI002619B99D|nr:SagB/ThcOx family dehydrogenase [uncultured Methanofollis sp.]
MNTALIVLLAAMAVLVGMGAVFLGQETGVAGERENGTVKLPQPQTAGEMSVEEALAGRRSVRDYGGTPLTLAELGQLLWAAQGVTDVRGYRTAPSAGALYPLEVTVATGNVADLPAGVYRYVPSGHLLRRLAEGDARPALARVALNQSAIEDAAAVIVISGVYERTTGKYGERGVRYVYMEAGHASQNIYLQAVPLGIGTVSIGAFDDGGVRRVMQIEEDERPLYLMPVGKV